MGHRPFFVLADHLTRHGVAVLRLDDRGVGESTGSFATATSLDFADDVVSAVEFLDQRSDVGPIGLIGHSEGGLVAPMVANRLDRADQKGGAEQTWPLIAQPRTGGPSSQPFTSRLL